MAITVSTYNQILGAMIRSIIANTPLNDLNTGSVLLTILQACASNDFENNAALLNVLNLFSLDNIFNNDLDNFASNLGLTRYQAIQASGQVNIYNTTITKISASIYPVTPAPIAGDTFINVTDASLWSPSGTLYIGRGTQQYEGPIPYTSIVNNTSYYTINLGAALANNHLYSDTVIDAQGTNDILISAGTVVVLPANNQNPQILYSTLLDAVIPAGEDQVDNVPIIAQQAGSLANAGINTITVFQSLPFTGATVSNPNPLTNGTNVEDDTDFRNRIKSYPNTLARGTEAAILSAIIGISDPTQNNELVSAVFQEPTSPGDIGVIYIDDGTGLQPTYQGQAIDVLLKDANGTEEYLQLANFPIPRPQAVNTVVGPYQLVNNMTLSVLVNGVEEVVQFVTDDFLNISAATGAEIATAINASAKTFACRLTELSQYLLLYPTDYAAETIQVLSNLSDANSVLQFPNTEFSYIRLYQNNVLLTSTQKNATLTTTPFSSWNITSAGDLSLSVDNTPPQDQTFTSSTFGGLAFSALSLDNWVTAFNSLFAGVTAVASPSGSMIITSNNSGANSSLEVLQGSYYSVWFDGQATSSTGQTSDFQLNRENGTINMLTTINPGDIVQAGSEDTKGNVVSSDSVDGIFVLSSDAENRPAVAVMVADATEVTPRLVNASTTTTITVSTPPFGSDSPPVTTGLMRLMASDVFTWENVQPLDYVYITNRGDIDGSGDGSVGGWLDQADCGLFKVADKGPNTTAGVDSFIDVWNAGDATTPTVPTGTYTVQDPADLQAFYSDKYPQVWNATTSSYIPAPGAATQQQVLNSINNEIINVIASAYKTSYVKVTSTTEVGGSFAIPVSVANAKNLFPTGGSQQTGSLSDIGSVATSRDLVTMFRRTAPTDTNVWLGRYTYSDCNDILTQSSIPYIAPDIAETLYSTGNFTSARTTYDDLVNVYRGDNRQLYRSIRLIDPSSNYVETQYDLPTTQFDHIQGDHLDIIKMAEFTASDTVVVIMDQNATDNTVDINMWRTGQVNGGNGVDDQYPGAYPPLNNSFSANDADNTPGIDFGDVTVWGTALHNTNFQDYAVWFQARNWYVTGGYSSAGNPAFMIRSNVFGPTGSNYKFQIEYPSAPNSTAFTTHVNTPLNSLITYYYGSGNTRTLTNLSAASTFQVSNAGGNLWTYDNISPSPSIDLSTVLPGDVVSIGSGTGFSAGNQGTFSVISTFYNSGPGTWQFTVNNANGLAETASVNQPTQFNIYPLSSTSVANIVASINTDILVNAVVINPGDITLATRDELSATSYGSAGAQAYINLYDANNWVLSFSNMNPNFALKDDMVLVGPAPAYYQMNTTINYDTSVGEYFKLIPLTPTNILHQFTQLPITQLPIIADINIADNYRRLQIKSTQFGSAGAVQVVGGQANGATFDLIGDGSVTPEDGTDYLQIELAALPASLSVGDTVEVTSTIGAPRLSRLGDADTVSVVKIADGVFQYQWNPAITNLNSYVSVTITDVSLTYGRAVGLVWRWTFNAAGSIDVITDKNDGVVATTPKSYNAAGTLGGAVALDVEVVSSGTVSSPQSFGLTVNALPTQADYFTFSSESGVTYAAWFDVDAAGIPPTGASYTAATNKIKVSVITGDTPNQTVSALNAALGATTAFNNEFTQVLSAGVTLVNVVDGDILSAYGTFGSAWAAGNTVSEDGTNRVAGLPIINVDAGASYVDVVNPYGSSMSTNLIGTGTVQIAPTPMIQWKLAHAANVQLTQVMVSSGTATAYTIEAHHLDVGDTFDLVDNSASPSNPGAGVGTVLTVINPNEFTYATTVSNNTYTGGYIINSLSVPTRYRIERLGFNNLTKIRYVDGAAPLFISCGAAVDDYVMISGNTFTSLNTGVYRIIGLTDDYLIIENPNAVDELNTTNPFNNNAIEVNWTTNSGLVTGVAGAFSNLSLGLWVKKPQDDPSQYRQVIGFNTGVPATATNITLGTAYAGTTTTSLGISYDQLNDVQTGVYLQNTDDILIFEGDSVRIGDQLAITPINNTSWFNTVNSGNYTIVDAGTQSSNYSVYVTVDNTNGAQQLDVAMSVNPSGLSIIESLAHAYTSYREVTSIAADPFDTTNANVFLTPADRAYKFSQTYGITVSAVGKLDFSADVMIGVDGYTYYTGLLKDVQNTVDGFEPDAAMYPGQKAIGAFLELLPPLVNNISISIDIVTQDGVNINDVENQIKTAIINYVQGQAVGQAIYLSDIIVAVMSITGILAVTFISPVPSTVSIAIAENEKAYITAADISISS